MKKKFFMPFCVLIAMAGCGKSVLDTTTNSSVVDEISTNNATLPWGETVYLPSGKTWTNVFADDFADTSNWRTENRTNWAGSLHNPALRVWYQKSNMVSISNGKLVLKSTKTAADELTCGSVLIDTANPNLSFKYGFFVAKMFIQNPLDVGSQSSFWLSYRDPRKYGGVDDPGGNDGAEIDVFESSWTNEVVGSGVHIDWYSSPYTPGNKGMGTWTAAGATTGYHQYGLWWTSNKLEIYFDGGTPKKTLTDTYYIPWVKEYMKLSTGAAWASANVNFDNADTGTTRTTLVDWVRVYQ